MYIASFCRRSIWMNYGRRAGTTAVLPVLASGLATRSSSFGLSPLLLFVDQCASSSFLVRTFGGTTPTHKQHQLLSFDVIRKIKKDLKRVDKAKDGHLDFEELQHLLQDYNFSDHQIEQIAELFYIGTSGNRIKHSTFLRSMQHIAATGGGGGGGTASDDIKNPLQLQSLDDKHQCFINPDGDSPYFETQKQFENKMMAYLREVNLVEEIGGSQVLQKAQELFRQKVMNDNKLSPFFVTDDSQRFLREYMSIAFSGNIPSGKTDSVFQDVKKAALPMMQHQGLNEEHFDLMLQYLVESLEEIQIDEDVIDMAIEMISMFRYIFASNLREQLGGDVVLDKAVDIFYDHVLKDDRISGFFDNTDMKKLKRKGLNFIGMAFAKSTGGGLGGVIDDKKMRYVRASHIDMIEQQGLGVEHFDIFMRHFATTLMELQIEPRVMDTALKVMDAYRPCFEKQEEQSLSSA